MDIHHKYFGMASGELGEQDLSRQEPVRSGLSLSLQADQQALVTFTMTTAKQPQFTGNIRQQKSQVRCVNDTFTFHGIADREAQAKE